MITVRVPLLQVPLLRVPPPRLPRQVDEDFEDLKVQRAERAEDQVNLVEAAQRAERAEDQPNENVSNTPKASNSIFSQQRVNIEEDRKILWGRLI